MNWRILFLLFLLSGLFYKGFEYYKQNTPRHALALPNSCLNKKYCITVFVAPWCEACKASQATFHLLSEYIVAYRRDIGFGVIVGAGTPDENKTEKNNLAPLDVRTDDSEQIIKNQNITSFPTWLLHDQTGKEILRKSSGVQVNISQVPYLLKDFFGI